MQIAVAHDWLTKGAGSEGVAGEVVRVSDAAQRVASVVGCGVAV